MFHSILERLHQPLQLIPIKWFFFHIFYHVITSLEYIKIDNLDIQALSPVTQTQRTRHAYLAGCCLVGDSHGS